jgi:hypothetical protein
MERLDFRQLHGPLRIARAASRPPPPPIRQYRRFACDTGKPVSRAAAAWRLPATHTANGRLSANGSIGGDAVTLNERMNTIGLQQLPMIDLRGTILAIGRKTRGPGHEAINRAAPKRLVHRVSAKFRI